MDAMDAAYHVVHDYPGGSVSLGPRVGISPAVLRSKVNRRCKTHRLGLDEAVRITELTGDVRIVQAFGAQQGFGLVRLDDEATTPSGSMLTTVLARDSAAGDLSSTLHAALSDGVVTQRECEQIEQAGLAVQAALVALLQHVARNTLRPPQEGDHA